MLYLLFRLSIAAIFLLSGSLLYKVGINYVGSAGSVIVKLHPSFYMLLICFSLTFLPMRGGNSGGLHENRLAGAYKFPLAAGLIATAVTAVLARSGTGDLSAVITTFVTPAVLVYLLQSTGAKTGRFISRFVMVLFFINSLLALAEFATGWRLLPFYAGAEAIGFDTRPTALLGHPLSNALLTGTLLLGLIARQITLGGTHLLIVNIVLHVLAMVAFGGRASLVLVGLFTFIYALRHTGLIFRVKGRQSLRSAILLIGGFALVAALFASGFASALLDRFSNATESTNTRYAALTLMKLMSLPQWLLGVDATDRPYYLEILQTPFGIEIAPIAMIFAYGLPLTTILLLSTYRLLFVIARHSGPGARYVVAFFILSTMTSLSIGSKSLFLSQVIVILIGLKWLYAPSPQSTASKVEKHAGIQKINSEGGFGGSIRPAG